MEYVRNSTVILHHKVGDDTTAVLAARVSTAGVDANTDGAEKLLRFLIKNRHASPFEHATLTFIADVPIFVAREWHRHRTQSYNEVSGRYKELLPRFYLPPRERPSIQVGKPGAYTFEEDTEKIKYADSAIWFHSSVSWQQYHDLLREGVAREVARMVLPVNIMTQFYATANLRNWLNFLSLRNSSDALYEIREAAAQVEEILLAEFPLTTRLWIENGRTSL